MLQRYRWLLTVFIIAIATIALLPFASELPDGLERVAEMFGFAESEQPVYSAPMRDYSVPQFGEPLGQAIAVLVGIFVTAGLTLLIGEWIRKAKKF
ncbi:MAG: PDGLE domain-containing protein [Candidatus Fervidibacter sp.]|uniref:PDGLE domain-containing protein n=1 Tax=Candidatus Fervidibacter sp. TaxID=3100871 RepID=UPI00404AFDE9